jgi:catechol 2,3-dioxygenase-like lactoylglutathione lyase family enzyme
MIIGLHSLIYSKDPDKDRAFLRDVLGLTKVDAGGGWLIFGLPPAELAVHPGDKNDVHELYLLCDDIDATVAAMTRHGIACGPVENKGWGLLTQLTLPGGGKLGVYEPRHARPKAMRVAGAGRRASRASSPARRRPAKPATKKPTTKKKARRRS